MPDPIDLAAEARAFMRSRVLLTAAELDIFTWLDGRDATAAEIARGLDADQRALTRLLDVLVGIGLLSKRNGRYANSEGAGVLSERNPNSVRASMLHQVRLWKTWSALTDVVRTGTPPDRAPAEEDPGRTAAFIGAMENVARRTAAGIAAAYDAARFSHLLDIGAGPGSYAIAFLNRHPGLRATLFDLPEVIELARENVGRAGLLDRVRFVAGDFYKDELPQGCDLALLSAIIHQNSPAQNLDLFTKAFRALEPGGVLLIRDHVMDEDRVRPLGGAFFALNMLVNTRGGDTYTFEEVADGLAAAGFARPALVQRGEMMDSLIEAGKAGARARS